MKMNLLNRWNELIKIISKYSQKSSRGMDSERDNDQINEEDQFSNEQQGQNPPKIGFKKSINQCNIRNYLPALWDQYFDEMFYLQNGTSVFKAGHQGAIFLCIHGAARCALTFACLSREVKKFGTLIAFDLKCHGKSKFVENPQDLSIETLTGQAVGVYKQICTRYLEQNIVLVGHELGGSVAARTAHFLNIQQAEKRLVGIVILDAVQGLALEGLTQYNQRLSNRPKYFYSIPEAIKWTQDTGALRRIESARISIPCQLKEIEYQGKPSYVWKIKLKRAIAGWQKWFKGLSSIFLSIKLPKILVSTEHQKLDQELTIAQMQGKFKHKMMQGAGHQVHEDDWSGTARMLYFFIKNFKIPMTVTESEQIKEKGIAHFHPHLRPF